MYANIIILNLVDLVFNLIAMYTIQKFDLKKAIQIAFFTIGVFFIIYVVFRGNSYASLLILFGKSLFEIIWVSFYEYLLKILPISLY